LINKFNKFLLWLGSTIGLFVVIITSLYYYFNNDISLEYIKPLERGYKFQLVNNTLFSQRIDSFRVLPDSSVKQNLVFQTTEDIKVKTTKDGVIIPGGNQSYMPALEYTGLDGVTIGSGVLKSFRLPPLSSRYYLKPLYAIFKIKYTYSSTNSILDLIDKIFFKLGYLKKEKTIRYLVTKNEWTEISNDDKVNIFDIICNEEDMRYEELCKTQI